MPHDLGNWSVTSSTWSRDFISKRFWVRILHIRHVITLLMPFIISFYQGPALVQVSAPFHMWKLRFHCVCTSSLIHVCTSSLIHVCTSSLIHVCTSSLIHVCTSSLIHVCIQSSKYKQLRHDSNVQSHEKGLKIRII